MRPGLKYFQRTRSERALTQRLGVSVVNFESWFLADDTVLSAVISERDEDRTVFGSIKTVHK